MDYKTKPTTRAVLRKFSKVFRAVYEVSEEGKFPVLDSLEKLPNVFPNCSFEILDDRELPHNTMAQCYQNERGGFTIAIKESVYSGAYRGIGSYLGFICHEMCHVFLFYIGFTPVFECSFNDREIPAFCSVEWQAKALCAEVMIPYEESKGMNEKEIIKCFNVSKAFAAKRVKLDTPVSNK